jgi:hypothetical protein
MTHLYNYLSISMLQVSLRFTIEFLACVWFYFSGFTQTSSRRT